MTDQADERTRLNGEAIAFLHDKTPEELLKLQEMLVATGFDESITGEVFGYACSRLVDDNPDQQYQFGLLLAQHSDPKLRMLAYWRLVAFQDQDQEAEKVLWSLVDDPDPEVAARYIEHLREDIEGVPRPFARIMELASMILSVEQRLQGK